MLCTKYLARKHVFNNPGETMILQQRQLDINGLYVSYGRASEM